MKTFLILGVNGMAGHVIAQYLLEQGHTVYGFARQESSVCETMIGDATNKEDVRQALQAHPYDYVVNAIGVLNRFVDEHPADGIYLNSVLPHFLAEELADTKTKLIHISTDCVFEGTKGRYTEADRPDASSYYGRSKALGEVCDSKNLTIRTSIIGPELKENGIGLFHWFMMQKAAVFGYQKVIWSGVTTLQLARVIAQECENPQTGLYHLVNNEFISKYNLLKLFDRYCRQNPIQIREERATVSDKTLINTRSEQPFMVPDYDAMVREMGDWIRNHPDLYQQYKGV